MGIRQLRYFVTVAEAKNLTRAAASLQVAQPAIGMQVRKLEETLGVKLLVRHSRGVEMTEAGVVLAARAMSLLQTYDEICQEIADFGSEPRGRVVLGMTKTAMHLVAGKLAKACRKNYPAINLALTENGSEQVVQGVANRRLDLGLTFLPGRRSEAGGASFGDRGAVLCHARRSSGRKGYNHHAKGRLGA